MKKAKLTRKKPSEENPVVNKLPPYCQNMLNHIGKGKLLISTTNDSHTKELNRQKPQGSSDPVPVILFTSALDDTLHHLRTAETRKRRAAQRNSRDNCICINTILCKKPISDQKLEKRKNITNVPMSHSLLNLMLQTQMWPYTH